MRLGFGMRLTPLLDLAPFSVPTEAGLLFDQFMLLLACKHVKQYFLN